MNKLHIVGLLQRHCSTCGFVQRSSKVSWSWLGIFQPSVDPIQAPGRFSPANSSQSHGLDDHWNHFPVVSSAGPFLDGVETPVENVPFNGTPGLGMNSQCGERSSAESIRLGGRDTTSSCPSLCAAGLPSRVSLSFLLSHIRASHLADAQTRLLCFYRAQIPIKAVSRLVFVGTIDWPAGLNRD